MKTSKKLFVLVLFALSLFALTSCKKDDTIQIGILQYLEHNALSAARQGFLDELEEAGFVDGENIKVTLLNPETDSATMSLQAKQLVRNSDLILAIATPAAVAVANEAKDQKKNVPILFTAVTNPVAANLIVSNESPGANVTGTNDMNPIVDQIGLVKELLPNATKVGILYTASETNSEFQANIAKTEIERLGMEAVIRTIESVNELQQVAGQLANLVDALYIPTDNQIAGAMGIIQDVIEARNIPAIVGESNLVDNGGTITLGINYYNLGRETALMAIQILRDGKLPSEIPSKGLTNQELVINKRQLDAMGISVSATLLERAARIIE